MHSIAFLAKPISSFANGTNHKALLAIKDLVTEDPSRFLSSWNDSNHFCNWDGVTCGCQHQRVTALNMSSLKLVCSLSPQIGNLTFLDDINIQETTSVAQSLKKLVDCFACKIFVWQITLSREKFHLTHCSHIRVIDLKGSNLEGSIPPELSILSKLNQLRSFLWKHSTFTWEPLCPSNN
ncbi:hypothetical protein TEA_022565 [Camellia sinensis var. sinensis]|uniref:Leucine-rich repeat-containing N-terminal plant-type domain-containing protein n=1 Tax=Camellia sinensis var. sinensis TaxID=542762 RepID=A0A4S4EYS8_CAMSN|nr:hypothetical protein TEA_022565 [Camellia sinensis var. sinensis]